MAARQVLDRVLAEGGKVVLDDPRGPRLLVPPALKPLVAEHRDAIRALVLEHPSVAAAWPDSIPETGDRRVGPLQGCALCDMPTAAVYGDIALCLPCATAASVVPRLALRAVLRRCFTLNAAGPDAPLAECSDALQAQARLWDDVGPGPAATILQVAARQWHRETSTCPWCAERGPLHLDEQTSAA